MSDRSAKKLITKEARVLKAMRERSGLSMRDAAEKSGLGASLINFIENGRQNILRRHLDALLPAYGQTLESFQEDVQSNRLLMSIDHFRCMELVQKLPDDLATAVCKILSKLLSNQG